MERIKNNFFAIFLLSAAFGLLSGFAGGIIAKSAILKDIFGSASWSDIDLSGNGNGSGIVITGARRVVVEQDDRTAEVAGRGRDNLVGFFKKNLAGAAFAFDLRKAYNLMRPEGEGLIVTSDGWILTNLFFSARDYVAIDSRGNIYEIEEVKKDPVLPFFFARLKAKELSSARLMEVGLPGVGQAVLAVNWRAQAGYGIVSSVGAKVYSPVQNSDAFSDQIFLSGDFPEDFKPFLIFDLRGEVIGLADKDGKIEPILHFSSALDSLFKSGEIKRPKLGINYVDLSSFVFMSERADYPKKGALIHKNENGEAFSPGSPAYAAGLREGDIIVSVNNSEVSGPNGLARVIQALENGAEIRISFLRNGEEKQVELVLGEVK